jgi:hypothetical protein
VSQRKPRYREIEHGFKGRMNVERAGSSRVASLTLALKRGIIKLVSVTLGQHARGTVEIREISALQGGRGARANESEQEAHEDKENQCLRPRDDGLPASCVRREHAAAVYRTPGGSATGSLDEGSSRRGLIPVIILIGVTSG